MGLDFARIKQKTENRLNECFSALSISQPFSCAGFNLSAAFCNKHKGNSTRLSEELQQFGNEVVVSAKLTHPDFLNIIDEGVSYYGGDQLWFGSYTRQSGGCGPVAAANLLAYLAITRPELAMLYGYDKTQLTREDFTRFMEEVYADVNPKEIYHTPEKKDAWRILGKEVPPAFGIVSLSYFAKGVERFAGRKGIYIKASWSSGKPAFENAVSYIRTGLLKNCPVALLNLFQPVDMQYTTPKTNTTCVTKYRRHWVTITGMLENTKTGEVILEASTWGCKALLSLNALWKHHWTSLLFPAGVLYFEHVQ